MQKDLGATLKRIAERGATGFDEGGLVRDVEEALKARGHALKAQELSGDAHSIYVDSETGVRMGGADPRRGGRAVGY